MTESPQVSIITPTYNAEKYIQECIDSILSQDYKNIEHIVVDGGSTDDTLSILKQNTSVKYISESDDGMSDAVNKGIALAKGKWIIWLNADDYLLPNAIKLLIEKSLKKPKANFIYGNIKFVDGKNELLRNVYQIAFRVNYVRFGLSMPAVVGALIDSNLLKQNLLSTERHYNMDTEFLLRNAEQLISASIKEFTLAFRFWEENRTSGVFNKTALDPQHLKERSLNDATYVYHNWKDDPKWLQTVKYKSCQTFYRPFFYFRKMKSLLLAKLYAR